MRNNLSDKSIQRLDNLKTMDREQFIDFLCGKEAYDFYLNSDNDNRRAFCNQVVETEKKLQTQSSIYYHWFGRFHRDILNDIKQSFKYFLKAYDLGYQGSLASLTKLKSNQNDILELIFEMDNITAFNAAANQLITVNAPSTLKKTLEGYASTQLTLKLKAPNPKFSATLLAHVQIFSRHIDMAFNRNLDPETISSLLSYRQRYGRSMLSVDEKYLLTQHQSGMFEFNMKLMDGVINRHWHTDTSGTRINCDLFNTDAHIYIDHIANKETITGRKSSAIIDNKQSIYYQARKSETVRTSGWRNEKFLFMRLRILFQMRIDLSRKLTEVPKYFDKAYSEYLKNEIFICSEAYENKILCLRIHKLSLNTVIKNQLFKSLAENIYEKVAVLTHGNEYVISTGYKTHAIYCVFFRTKTTISIRIDNFGAGRSNAQKDKNSDSYLRAHLLAKFNVNDNPNIFEQDKDNIINYIQNILMCAWGTREQAIPTIYDDDFQQKYNGNRFNMNKLPQHPPQAIGNCVAENYKAGIRTRIITLYRPSSAQGFSFYQYCLNEEELAIKRIQKNRQLIRGDEASIVDTSSHDDIDFRGSNLDSLESHDESQNTLKRNSR